MICALRLIDGAILAFAFFSYRDYGQLVVEKLPSFVKYLIQKVYKSAFLVRFVVALILHICLWRVPWLHGCGRNARNVYNQIHDCTFSEERE